MKRAIVIVFLLAVSGLFASSLMAGDHHRSSGFGWGAYGGYLGIAQEAVNMGTEWRHGVGRPDYEYSDDGCSSSSCQRSGNGFVIIRPRSTCEGAYCPQSETSQATIVSEAAPETIIINGRVYRLAQPGQRAIKRQPAATQPAQVKATASRPASDTSKQWPMKRTKRSGR